MYDEPTAGLDPVASTVVEDLIRELHEKHGEGHHHPQHAPQARTRGKHIGGHRGSASFHAPLPAARGGDGNGATATATTTATVAPKQACPGGVTSYVVVTHQHSTIRRAGGGRSNTRCVCMPAAVVAHTHLNARLRVVILHGAPPAGCHRLCTQMQRLLCPSAPRLRHDCPALLCAASAALTQPPRLPLVLPARSGPHHLPAPGPRGVGGQCGGV